MTPQTVSRAATRKIAAIKATNLTCRVYSLRNDFNGAGCDPHWAWDDLAKFHQARLTWNDSRQRWTVRVHDNLWYELTETPGDDTPAVREDGSAATTTHQRTPTDA